MTEDEEYQEAIDRCDASIGAPITCMDVALEDGIVRIEHGRGWLEIRGDDLELTVYLDELDS
jgi:hypothetical protein